MALRQSDLPEPRMPAPYQQTIEEVLAAVSATRDGLSADEALWAINEKQFRGPTGTWLLMTPKAA